jgi:hypothetical protein
MDRLFNHFPNSTCHDKAHNAYSILCSTHETVTSLYNIYKTLINQKDQDKITEQEQDLLRAILIFATSGIDSMIKQLIRDSLPLIIQNDAGAANIFSSFIEKEISKKDELNIRLLTSALICGTPKDHFIEYMIRNLTSNSLQSKDELLKIASYFNIPSIVLTKDINLLKEIFDVRNQIAHEMDFDYRIQGRRRREESVMISYTNEILRISQVFLHEVDKKLLAT